MQLNEKEIVNFFNAKRTGTKGWIICENNCPYCNKPHHLAIIFGKVSSFVCKKCGESGIISKLLKKVNKLDLIIENKIATPYSKLISIEDEKGTTLDLNYKVEETYKPIGFIRIYKDNYLDSRGFIPIQYQIYEIGKSIVDPRVGSEYIIFIVKQFNKIVGWLARSNKEKEEIDKINEKRKLKGRNDKYLRWINQAGVDFSKLMLGYDEVIIGETNTIFIVEGVTSKFNIDKLLNLYDSNEIKCLCSFGKKLSPQQIKSLQDLKIENIILLYDSDAIKESKIYSFELEKYFNVDIGFIPFKNEKGKDKDAGDINIEELNYVLNTLQSPISFFINYIPMTQIHI